MANPESLLTVLGVAVLVYPALIAGRVVVGRRSQASALARFIPDCLVLLRRVIGDEQVPRSRFLPA